MELSCLNGLIGAQLVLYDSAEGTDFQALCRELDGMEGNVESRLSMVQVGLHRFSTMSKVLSVSTVRPACVGNAFVLVAHLIATFLPTFSRSRGHRRGSIALFMAKRKCGSIS